MLRAARAQRRGQKHTLKLALGLLARGKTIVLTTHFMEEAERLCSRVAIVDHGRIIAQASPRALIEREIEREVLEVTGDEAAAWARAHAAALCDRLEVAGETAFLYCGDPSRALQAASERSLRVLRRPATLEDVFLKLTGRDLRD